MAWTWWRSPQGAEHLLAAGSRRVTRLIARGPDWSVDRPAPDRTLAVDRPAPDRTLAVERPARAAVRVEALLDNGSRINPPN